MTFRTEVEELDAAARAIGRKLEDIEVTDRPRAPKGLRYCATWDPYDQDCPIGYGATPQEAMHDLIVFSQ